MTVTLPLLYTGSYLKRQNGVGNLYVGSYASAGGGGTVFDNLVNPPTAGVTAEAASLSWAQSKGSGSTVSTNHGKSWYTPVNVTSLVKKNMDFVMLFYLEASIARSGGVPVF